MSCISHKVVFYGSKEKIYKNTFKNSEAISNFSQVPGESTCKVNKKEFYFPGFNTRMFTCK